VTSPKQRKPRTNDAMTELRLRHLRESVRALAAARERVLLASNAKEQEQLVAQLGEFEREIVRCRKALGLPAVPLAGVRR